MTAYLPGNGQSGSRNKIGYVTFLESTFFPTPDLFQRQVYLRSRAERSPTSASFSRGESGYASPSLSTGYQTPRELKEEQWKLEAQVAKPGKVEMREMYKELGGRKARAKTKLGSSGIRDKGGWNEDGW
jgi:hypothetical protein